MALSRTEEFVFFLLHGYDVPGLNQLMIFFSGQLLWLPLAAALIWKIYRLHGTRRTLTLVVLALLLLAVVDTSTSYFFKNLVRRLRPCKMTELQGRLAQFGQGCGGKWGFFSSHAANSIALAVFLAPFAGLRRWEKTLLGVTVLLVGYSRIYLGVHLPLDIVVGYAWGALLALGWVRIARAALTAPGAA